MRFDKIEHPARIVSCGLRQIFCGKTGFLRITISSLNAQKWLEADKSAISHVFWKALERMTVIRELRGLCILIIEENKDFADELADTLHGWGCEVVGPVPSVCDAFALNKDKEIHGAIFGLIHGSETAFAVASELKAQNIPFLFVSGYDLLPDFTNEFQVMPRIAKPFDAATLAAAMIATFGVSE